MSFSHVIKINVLSDKNKNYFCLHEELELQEEQAAPQSAVHSKRANDARTNGKSHNLQIFKLNYRSAYTNALPLVQIVIIYSFS